MEIRRTQFQRCCFGIVGGVRCVGRFNWRFPAGEIVVNFEDRLLCYVTRLGEAISYPIAIPRVSDKKLNPPRTPMPMLVAAENMHRRIHQTTTQVADAAGLHPGTEGQVVDDR
jgi:hypothetical protein